MCFGMGSPLWAIRPQQQWWRRMKSADSLGGNASPGQEAFGSAGHHRVPEALHYLAVALAGHVHRLQVQGVPVPHEVEHLAVFFLRLARSRQESTFVAVPHGTGHYSPMPNRLLITKAEAAERLGVSVRTIERLVATGRLPQVHIERLARFRVKDLECYVENLLESGPGAVGEGGEEADPSSGDHQAPSFGAGLCSIERH